MKKYTELIDENNQEVKGWSFENMISYQFFLSKMYLLLVQKHWKEQVRRAGAAAPS